MTDRAQHVTQKSHNVQPSGDRYRDSATVLFCLSVVVRCLLVVDSLLMIDMFLFLPLPRLPSNISHRARRLAREASRRVALEVQLLSTICSAVLFFLSIFVRSPHALHLFTTRRCFCPFMTGKFTAGKPGDEFSTPLELNPKDPNYDDEEDENVVLVSGRVTPFFCFCGR
jgi:hypothetical protein